MKIRVETDKHTIDDALEDLQYYLPDLADKYNTVIRQMKEHNCTDWTFIHGDSIRIVPACYRYYGNAIVKHVGYVFIFKT